MNDTLVMPRRSGWAIPDDGLEVLAELVRHVQGPAFIVETGSGRSTVAIAAAIGEDGGRLVSLEHLPDHQQIAQAALDANGFAWADVRLAPIDPLTNWYDRRAWDQLHAIGMLVVDGPPGHLTQMARQPALPQLRDKLEPGCLVVLDDIHRPDERAAWETWRSLGLSEPTIVRHSGGALAHGTIGDA